MGYTADRIPAKRPNEGRSPSAYAGGLFVLPVFFESVKNNISKNVTGK